jgi:hypothetical protein
MGEKLKLEKFHTGEINKYWRIVIMVRKIKICAVILVRRCKIGEKSYR